ncbi:gamma-glutamyltransferase [Sulfobacillus thermotolerans]|uniref:Gamma-glutamyltransferase n=1 Tax=Sulfobacillus thermotolerans TaxID=338644 RepID=A0ABM6RP38_9FIRM|nr:gamma-glutamyltransferase [Sulfobacillus thermotolerans]
MKWDANVYPSASRRTVVYATHGMVATAQPLAAQAGLEILQAGGNAIDAAIATAACLTVVEPTSNGLGGDAFAMVWSGGRLTGLNASGPAPQGLTKDWIRERGFHEMPATGWGAVTIPGIPAAWAVLSERFGSMPLEVVLKPAIRLAREGFPVSPTVAHFWQRAAERYREVLTGPEFSAWFETFTKHGRAPVPGERWVLPDHAKTLQEIANTHAESFYRGRLAQEMVRFSHATGGILSLKDFGAYAPEWVDPLSVAFRDYEVWELPPNGQGLVALMALKILEGLDAHSEEERIHQQIEALKLAFADAQRYLADPQYMASPPAAFLDAAYLQERRSLIGPKAALPHAGLPRPGGTVYLATADNQGNMVSYIQSNFAGFGSGLVVPGTGIALQNRGQLFSLEEGHPNILEPGKRPYHTIIPGFLTQKGKPIGPFGVMGGFMQPQGHVQVLSRVLEGGMNPQAALDAPRFYWEQGMHVVVEHTMAPEIVAALRERGHDVQVTTEVAPFGRGQIVWQDGSGVLIGATEPRADGMVAAW